MNAIAPQTTMATAILSTVLSLLAGPIWSASTSETDSLGQTSPTYSNAAAALHVGMSKRFHLRDGNAITGKIVDIDGVDVCTIETLDGTRRIPASVILEETVEVVKKDDTGYDGPVLKEDSQEVVVRSRYGDVVVSKEDIREMHRYYGGKRISWAEEKKRFYQGEATLTGTFTDPTAFLLRPHTFYTSGLSLGYGFSERFNVFTEIGPDFNGALNVKLRFAVFQRAQGASETALAIGLGFFRDHRMISRYRQYSHWLGRGRDGEIASDDDRFDSISPDVLEMEDVLEGPDARQFDWTFHTVLSHRQPLSSGRGKWGGTWDSPPTAWPSTSPPSRIPLSPGIPTSAFRTGSGPPPITICPSGSSWSDGCGPITATNTRVSDGRSTTTSVTSASRSLSTVPVAATGRWT